MAALVATASAFVAALPIVLEVAEAAVEAAVEGAMAEIVPMFFNQGSMGEGCKN